MDVVELNDLFLEAAETERKLPPAVRKQKMCAWPDYVTSWSAYGYNAFEMLDDDDRRLVWAVAHSAAFRQRGPSWSKIARLLSLNDPRIVKKRYKDALIRLYYKI